MPSVFIFQKSLSQSGYKNPPPPFRTAYEPDGEIFPFLIGAAY